MSTPIVEGLIRQKIVIPGGRYLYASGRDLHQTQNCALFRAGDSREGWADLGWKTDMSLMTGAGVGVDYSDVRCAGSIIKRTGGEASGPISLMKKINESGRNIMQGGARRSAIWAGLSWKHDDVEDFIRIKDWDEETKQKKEEDFNHPAPLDMTNVSVILDDDFFAAYAAGDARAHRVYRLTVSHMVRTAEPGFSIDVGKNAGETLRNACTEVTSRDDSDICNLGSINLARITSPKHMEEAVQYATLFLLAGTCYSDVPTPEIAEVRERNRRLGLGLMGAHEWLLMRGKKYEPDDELEELLEIYERVSDEWAEKYAEHYGVAVPLGKRAIAPTGTIAIGIAETTTGWEPMFCRSYKRRYKEASPTGPDITRYQYVVDPTARRVVEKYGIDPKTIEDAYSIPVERRIQMQAWVQKFVDHGVSSTVNMKDPITDDAEAVAFGNMLLPYLPELRGITCYPDGARGGQPLTPVDYDLAIAEEGVVFTEHEDRCVGGSCGI